jgi:hypothetical protein
MDNTEKKLEKFIETLGMQKVIAKKRLHHAIHISELDQDRHVGHHNNKKNPYMLENSTKQAF